LKQHQPMYLQVSTRDRMKSTPPTTAPAIAPTFRVVVVLVAGAGTTEMEKPVGMRLAMHVPFSGMFIKVTTTGNAQSRSEYTMYE
jgi:hypothetical protein